MPCSTWEAVPPNDALRLWLKVQLQQKPCESLHCTSRQLLQACFPEQGRPARCAAGQQALKAVQYGQTRTQKIHTRASGVL
jgi:hypothetical protein